MSMKSEMKSVIKELDVELKNNLNIDEYHKKVIALNEELEKSKGDKDITEREFYILESGYGYDRDKLYDDYMYQVEPLIKELKSKYSEIINKIILDFNDRVESFVLGELGDYICSKYGYKSNSKKHLNYIGKLSLDPQYISDRVLDVQSSRGAHYVSSTYMYDFFNGLIKVIKGNKVLPFKDYSVYNEDHLIINLDNLTFEKGANKWGYDYDIYIKSRNNYE